MAFTTKEQTEKARQEIVELEYSELETLQKIEDYKNKNKSKYFKPFNHQRKVIELLRAGRKTVLMQGANQIGKTELVCNLMDSFCNGTQRWDDRPGLFNGRPIRARIICSDWEHHAAQTVMPKLKEWVTAGTYETKKNNVGVEAFWRFKSGSTIEFMTHDQETKVHEGWTGDVVWFDEPPPRDKYTANARGLVAHDGIMIITMTDTDQPWVLKEIAQSTDPTVGKVTEIPMSANTSLSPKAIEIFRRKCPEDEVDARVYGKWKRLIGLILKKFNKDVHILKKPFKIPSDWPVVAMIDWHLSKPIALSFYTVDKVDRSYAIDEVFENMSPEQIADEIIKRKIAVQTCWNITDAYIDPLAKGDAEYMKNRFNVPDAFSIIKSKLERHGIILRVASKDKSSGIQNLKDALEGANGQPSLFFFPHLTKHFEEIQEWRFDKNGDPVKENDHFMENMYRFTLTGTKYVEPSLYTGKLKIPELNIA